MTSRRMRVRTHPVQCCLARYLAKKIEIGRESQNLLDFIIAISQRSTTSNSGMPLYYWQTE